MDKSDRFSSFTFGEGRTGGGQMVSFAYPYSGDKEENISRIDRIHRVLKEDVRSIDVPVTGQVKNIAHGSYGRYTRYNIIQHNYAGGGHGGDGGYIEILEIKDPPDGRHGIVEYYYSSSRGSIFAEWSTLKDAKRAFKKYWLIENETDKLRKMQGFKRLVVCNQLIPWFYAIGDEQLVGDFAFPEGLQDDPVFRFGRKFVVFDKEDIPTIKTCMGTRFLKKKNDYTYSDSRGEENYRRLVHWDDGSIWDEIHEPGNKPRPLEDGELWIDDAICQFKQLLAGRKTDFSINFTDGNKFVGKLVPEKRGQYSVEGTYYAEVELGNGKELKKGTVDFKPNPENPDVVSFITKKMETNGLEVTRVKVLTSKSQKGGKKWAGVFFNSGDKT